MIAEQGTLVMIKTILSLTLAISSTAHAFSMNLETFACLPIATGITENAGPLYLVSPSTIQSTYVTNQINEDEKTNTFLLTTLPETGNYEQGSFKFGVTDTFDENVNREFRATYYNIDDMLGTYFVRALTPSQNQNSWSLQNFDPITKQKWVDPKLENKRILFAKLKDVTKVIEVNCENTTTFRVFPSL